MRQPPNDFRDASRSTAQVAVSVRDVSLRYGEKFAVRDASFDLEKGKFLTILGPSGSGKTTLLRIVAGFVSPTKGEVLINGRSTVSLRPHKRSIGMVFQKLALFPHMTVAQNVAFPLKMRRFDARAISDRVDKYLDLVRLGGFGGRRIHELSGGQQQRVAIARALVFEPDLLLLDEPLAALDRKLREEMQLEFRRIQRSLGVTTINVTHDQREALVVSDQIIVMDNARIQQKATPDITYRNPANSFVAGFIGVTNFLDGLVHSTDGELVRYAAGVQQLAGKWSGLSEPPQTGTQVTGALRAENVLIAGQPDDHRRYETIVEGTVLDAIYEGERVVYEIAVPAADGAVIRAYHHQSDARPVFGRGARVHLGWNAQDLMVFGD